MVTRTYNKNYIMLLMSAESKLNRNLNPDKTKYFIFGFKLHHEKFFLPINFLNPYSDFDFSFLNHEFCNACFCSIEGS